jgi:hypothetical protein
MAAEYAVASELCRRDTHALLTLGNHKSTDILVESDKGMVRVQVKGKRGGQWPQLSSPAEGDTCLVFVDFKGKSDNERPDFYVLTAAEWNGLLRAQHGSQGDRPDISPSMVEQHRDRWQKLAAT